MGLNSIDYKRLNREAREHHAVIAWNHDTTGLEILIHAPRGFLWLSCQNSTIRHFTEKHDGYVSEAVDSVIQAMTPGTQLAMSSADSGPDDSDEECTGEHTCECSRCEAYDPEIEELRFC